jgi:hypothetical protein
MPAMDGDASTPPDEPAPFVTAGPGQGDLESVRQEQ